MRLEHSCIQPTEASILTSSTKNLSWGSFQEPLARQQRRLGRERCRRIAKSKATALDGFATSTLMGEKRLIYASERIPF
ncbi:hypothetical protein PGTUg99_025130 [Puccinia graminis f. sp. tritici]|uniref:Uncharacterized protein n=1 Tax=Puccinia graminis f. sp. tritici TaxID=56615 RepID=A0A5B0N444_PUCGR|nr:hypothetical protein PGTUg99_025130 [Puccinia graminis f. sp. tritici]